MTTLPVITSTFDEGGLLTTRKTKILDETNPLLLSSTTYYRGVPTYTTNIMKDMTNVSISWHTGTTIVRSLVIIKHNGRTTAYIYGLNGSLLSRTIKNDDVNHKYKSFHQSYVNEHSYATVLEQDVVDNEYVGDQRIIGHGDVILHHYYKNGVKMWTRCIQSKTGICQTDY